VKVIILSKKYGNCRSFNLGIWSGALLSVCFACLIGVPAAAYLTYLKLADDSGNHLLGPEIREIWAERVQEQELLVAQARQEADNKLAALTLRVAELQARLVRIDALGERLTSMAKLDNGEFDFSLPPALGGPELEASGDSFAAPEFAQAIDDLAQQIESRQHQLQTLEALLANRKLESDVFIAGRPITKGWMSSRFGRRTDPFTGKIAWHSGVDFAGKEGSDIIAVAAGVVTWSGDRQGYGLMVEVSHGKGFITRYAHNKENLAKVGDVVKKGQIIALMGTTGRSTGYHVHFEVYKNGRAVDPSSYIHRTSR
jgi:murein DD-endopeptidase MepM/ murein hydrolase activator NlpD